MSLEPTSTTAPLTITKPPNTTKLPTGASPVGDLCPQSAPNTSPAKKESPRAIIGGACASNNVAEVARGLRLGFPTRELNNPEKERDRLRWALRVAVRSGSVEVTVGCKPSAELLDVLYDHGWDIHQNEPDFGSGPGPRLLQLVVRDETLVRWCLDHGVSVHDPHDSPFVCPPLLESVAVAGTISTFGLLHGLGAVPGPRTLHKAVESAAYHGGDPARSPQGMAMVEYLVDEVGLDVNALDTNEQRGNHWGTPLCYAAKEGSGAETVVRFLLDRGADPTIKDSWGFIDAFVAAKRNERLTEMFRDWKSLRSEK